MRCIIFGHTPHRFPGAGQHQGREFDICVECGMTWPVVDGSRAEAPLNVVEPLRTTETRVH